jgi:hypothetical protein
MKDPKRQDPAAAPRTTGKERHRERLRRLAAQVKPILPEVPHAAELHGELEENLLMMQFLEAEHDLLTAQLARVRRHRVVRAEQAQDLASRLAALLYGTFGRDRLRELGLPVGSGRPGPRGATPEVN